MDDEELIKALADCSDQEFADAMDDLGITVKPGRPTPRRRNIVNSENAFKYEYTESCDFLMRGSEHYFEERRGSLSVDSTFTKRRSKVRSNPA